MDTPRTVIVAIGPDDVFRPENRIASGPQVDDEVLEWSLEPGPDGWFTGDITTKTGKWFMNQVRLGEEAEFDVDLDADPAFLQRLNPDLEIPGAEQVAETSAPVPVPECGDCQYYSRPECATCYPDKCKIEGRCTGWCDRDGTPSGGTCEENSRPDDWERHPQVEAEQNEITAEEIAARLPTDSQARKDVPLARGVLDYFPDALAEVARLSKAGNDKHNPGEDLHWARSKSNDHADCIMRHLVERGEIDTDGISHTAKVAWRALALLQEELEAAGAPMSRGSR